MSRYRLHIRGDGGEAVEPGYELVSDDYEPAPGEAVLGRPPGPGEVWDAASGTLRPRTGAEELAALKAEKVEEIAADAVGALAPMFTPNAGRDEAVLLIAGHVLMLCEAVKVTPDPRLREVVATGEKALRLKAEVAGAGSVEELEGIGWTP